MNSPIPGIEQTTNNKPTVQQASVGAAQHLANQDVPKPIPPPNVTTKEHEVAQNTVAVSTGHETNIQQPIINPLLDKIRIPGQTYQIPSQGLFYTNNELSPDVVQGEVHVYPMTTIDEIVIRTPDMLFSGDAIEQVFKRCIPQILHPKELFAKDVDFLMVCLRQVSYGEEFEITHTHNCEDAKSHDYMILMNQFIKNTKQLDPVAIQKTFTVTLDNGQVVKIHPIKYVDVVKIMQVFEEDITPQQQQDRMVTTLLSIIDTVDDVTDKKFIEEWLISIPVTWAKQLSSAIDATSDWGPNFTTKIKCSDCDVMMEVAVPMNPVSFFI
jgi:hypothetical protein